MRLPHLLPIFILGILVLVLLATNAKTKLELMKYENPKITGTYSIGSVQETTYAVFLNDGSYYRYRQFQLLDRGTYEESSQRVYTIHSQRGKRYDAVLSGDRVFLPWDGEEVVGFERISDVGMFINLTREKTRELENP